MKSIIAITISALICMSTSEAEEPSINVYGPEPRNGDKTQLVYVTVRIMEFEKNPFDADSPNFSLPKTIPKIDLATVFNPLTYFEINTLRFLPAPYNEGASEYFSQVENLSDSEKQIPTIRKGISGLLSDPQFQVLIRIAAHQRDVDIHQVPSAFVSEEQFFTAQLEGRVILAVGASPKGEGAIALSLFTPSHLGAPLLETPTTSLVVVDGVTIAYTVEGAKGGKTRVYFIKPQLLDPTS